MMTTVSARIPDETQRRAVARLNQIGSSQSELIRTAYDYVAACGHLPAALGDSDRRTLDEQRRCAIADLCERSSIRSVTQRAGVGDAWYARDLVAASRRRRYEALG
ncbi:MAG: hypothetical protein IKG18_04990 [Atopobiaceae bacterium]|nr:hypothetical protein [Atopobiaceae bacterium]MBR3313479.1 hypothetical protein [Atopobiaceae bacterium]